MLKEGQLGSGGTAAPFPLCSWVDFFVVSERGFVARKDVGAEKQQKRALESVIILKLVQLSVFEASRFLKKGIIGCSCLGLSFS